MAIFTVIQGGKSSNAKATSTAQLKLAVSHGTSPEISLDEMVEQAQTLREAGALPARPRIIERPCRRDTNYCNDITDAELRRQLLQVKVGCLDLTLAEILEKTEADLANPRRPGSVLKFMGVLLECGLILVATLPEHDLACRAYYDFSQNCLFFESYPEFQKYQSRIMAPDFYLA